MSHLGWKRNFEKLYRDVLGVLEGVLEGQN